MSGKETLSPTTPLPLDQLPECWNQDERMKSLFAPFRNRSANPEDWNSKYKFWNQLIKTWTSYHARCSFSLTDLTANLKRNGCSALCLPTVLEELYKNGEVIPESDFMKEPSSTWTGWTIDLFVKKPVSWSFSKLKSYVSEPVIDNNMKYIHLPTVKELGELILSIVDTKKENTLLSLSELTKSCIAKSGNTRITESNIRLALIWLRHNKKAAFRDCIKDDKHDLLVKISPRAAEQVTEVDEGLHKLTQQESMLIKNIEQLETERNEVILKAKSSLASGLRQVAKSFLRKKHELDKCIEKRSAALQNTQRLLARIHDARYDTDTLAAYKAGCNALKKFEDTGLTEDNVQDTMDDMTEILDELNEVQSAMTQPVTSNESDAELEKELAEIMGTAWNDSADADKSKNQSFNSAELPDLSELDLLDIPAPKNKVSIKPTQPSQT
ncbi:charged multivesicular body protein 7 [Nasonia vitripennis]|uniref:Charged multivesicular body protein 7 n=1 Tax=Nasonia vitripennis TaxID=7425 RepID=A0A7M7QJP0_NASVI|nr:charged multivesicular body protein 7 [Nasonia vitripennis]XP_032456914.1 charged multivesicular body protein 7 [Nasonia vitripennis]